MDAGISPEPSPEERAALARALEALAERESARDPAASAWWRAGIRENVDEDQAAAGPRSNPGAKRA